jgi:hypothetical protein
VIVAAIYTPRFGGTLKLVDRQPLGMLGKDISIAIASIMVVLVVFLLKTTVFPRVWKYC